MANGNVPVKELRETIKQLVRDHDWIHKHTIVNEVAVSVDDASTDAVRHELARMNRNGEIYYVGDEDDNPEVRLP